MAGNVQFFWINQTFRHAISDMFELGEFGHLIFWTPIEKNVEINRGIETWLTRRSYWRSGGDSVAISKRNLSHPSLIAPAFKVVGEELQVIRCPISSICDKLLMHISWIFDASAGFRLGSSSPPITALKACAKRRGAADRRVWRPVIRLAQRSRRPRVHRFRTSWRVRGPAQSPRCRRLPSLHPRRRRP